MDAFLNILKAVLYGIVEGITEWLPVSSTGHLILVEDIVKFNFSDAFLEMFRVVIQLGAIMAVVILYFHRLNPFSSKKSPAEKNKTWDLWFKVIVACVPAAIIGILFDDKIDSVFYNAWVVSATLIIYGVLFIILESRNVKPKIHNINQMSYKFALAIGAFQVLALIPGTSRSGATILGAVFLGASRAVSAEFSFFLSIPVMVGASLLKIAKVAIDINIKKTAIPFTGSEWTALFVGLIVAFIVSIFAIKYLMAYIKNHNFKAFGYYRIVLGAVVVVYFLIRTFA